MTIEPGVRPAIAMLLLASVVTAHLAAQQNTQPRTPERGADHLAVHFAVVSADGTPVNDLRAQEVTIRIGGRVRAIRSLQRIASAGTPGALDASADLPLPFGTNAVAASGRTLLMLVDDESFRPGLEGVLRQAAGALIKGLAPTDRVSLVTLPLGGIRVPFTNDHARLRTAVAQIVGHAPANLTGSDLACRTRRTLESLVRYFETLGVRDEPLTMMFVTSGLAAPRRDALSGRAPGMCELSEHLFGRVAVAAGAARAQFYVIRPGDAPDAGSNLQRESGGGSDNPLAGIDHLVGVTGGKLLSLTGSTGTAMERVLRETSAHYVASVDTDRNDRTGRSQQLDIDVSRGGTEVRTQPHITFAKTDAVTAKLLQPSLRDMLSTQVLFRELPLRAAGFPALDTDSQSVRIVTLAEPVEAGVKLESLAAVLLDRDGRVASQWLATGEELQRRPVMGAMSAPPGDYRLRVAAIDVNGRSGTADYDVTAEIVRTGPLRISSLVLGLSRDGAFVPKLQFTNEPLAIAYVELEGAAAGSKVAAGLEVAQTLNGPAIAAMPLTIERATEHRYAAMGSVAIGALPPGDYVVRAMVGLEGHPMTRVVRALRKVK